MALPATGNAELQPTAGSDTNGGIFDPALTGCTPATDLAVVSGGTSASPVVSSASYNFVAGDVGAWLFISAGTNFNFGWYKIASVASNQATLDAAVGHAVLYNGATPYNTSAGLGTGTSGGTWTVDYTQQASARVTVTDAVTNNTTTVTSATAGFGKNHVGNAIYLSGTGTTTSRYLITAVASSTSITVDRATGSTGGTGVTLNIGGAFLTIGEVLTSARGIVGGNNCWVKNTGTMSVTSAPSTMPTGVNWNNPTQLVGYNSLRGDLDYTVYNFTNHPLFQVNNASIVLLSIATSCFVRNLILDAAGGATKGTIGINASTSSYMIVNCKFTGGWTSRAVTLNGSAILNRCYVTGANGSSGAVFANGGSDNFIISSVITANTCAGVNSSGTAILIDSVIDSNSGASSDGVVYTTGRIFLRNCTIRNNGRDGIRLPATELYTHIQNNIITENAGFGINFQGSADAVGVSSNAYWSNTSGDLSNSVPYSPIDVILTGSPYTSTANGDFSLNNTAGAGAACRGTGFPGTFPGGTTVGHIDIGAVQSPGTAPVGLITGARSIGTY